MLNFADSMGFAVLYHFFVLFSIFFCFHYTTSQEFVNSFLIFVLQDEKRLRKNGLPFHSLLFY